MTIPDLKALPQQPNDLYERVDLDDYRKKVQEATRFSFQKTIDSTIDTLVHLFSKKPPKQNLSEEINRVFRQNHPNIKRIPTLDSLTKIASHSQESFTEIENAACEVRIQLAVDLYKQTHSQQALKHQMRTEWFIVQELNEEEQFKTLSSTEKQLVAKAIFSSFSLEKQESTEYALTSARALLREIDESSPFEDLCVAKLLLRTFPELEEELDEKIGELLFDISSEKISEKIKAYVQKHIDLYPECYNSSINDDINTDSVLKNDAERCAFTLEYKGKKLLLSKETLKETESLIREIVRNHCPLGVERYDESLQKAVSSPQKNAEMLLRVENRLKQDPDLDQESVENAVLDEEISLLDQKQLRTILQDLLAQGGLNPVVGCLPTLFAVQESDFYLGDHKMLLYIERYAKNPAFRALSEIDGALRLSFVWEGYLKPGPESDKFSNLGPLSRKEETLALQHTRYSTIHAEYTYVIARDRDGEWKVTATLDDLVLDFKTPFPNTLYDLIGLPQDPSSTDRNGMALHFLTYSPQLLDFKSEESLLYAMKGIPNSTPSEQAEAASCVWRLLNDPTELEKAKECCDLFASLHSKGLKQLRTAFTVATEMKLEPNQFEQFTREQQLIASHLFIANYPSGNWDYVDPDLLKEILSSNLNTPDFRYQAALLFSVFSDLSIHSPPPLLELTKNHHDLGLSLKQKMFDPEKGLTSPPEALRIDLEAHEPTFYKRKRANDEVGRNLLNPEINWDEEIADLIDLLVDNDDDENLQKSSSLRALLNLALSKSTSEQEHHPGGLDPIFSLATALSTWFPHESLKTLFLRLLDRKSPLEIAFTRTQNQKGAQSLLIEYRYRGLIVPFADGTTPEDFISLTDEEEKRLLRHPRYIPISMNYSIELQETDEGWICPNPPRIEPPILFAY